MTAAVILLASAIFFLDLLLPLGVAAGVPYVALVLLGWWFEGLNIIVLLGVAASVLTFLGYLLSSSGGIEWMVLTNRSLALFAIWVTVVLLRNAKRSEGALRENEDYFRSLYHQSPVMMHSIGMDGRLISVSDHWLRKLGYERDEVIGRKATDFLTELSRRRAFDEILPKLYDTGSAEDVPYQFVTRDGKIVDVLLSAIMKKGFMDGRSRSLTVLTDVTERKRAEQEVYRLNESLERRVEERTSELRAAQEELLRQARLATLGQLTATVSHELRNPLGVIRTSAFVVREGLSGEAPRVQRSLERIERSIIRCDRIIDELLDFTRISQLAPKPTPLDAWLEKTLNQQTLPSGVVLRLGFGMPGMTVPFDHDSFRRAIINVFDNACQAMIGEGLEDAGSEEHILTVRTQDHHGRVEVIFEDTGPGMPPEVYEKIFEPLYSTKGFGIGLGLPVVKQIMEQHGGGIEIESEEGRGARVCLWLPHGHTTH